MRSFVAASLGALAMMFALTARAQESSAYLEQTQESSTYLKQTVAAPSGALEFKVGNGYTQGFGNVAPGRGVDSIAGAGFGVSADIDYRLNRPWSLGLEGQYQEFASADNSSSRGLAANLGATYHFAPVLRGDPWVRLGTGFRWLWENGPGGGSGQARHDAFELLNAKIGYDVRVSQDVALGPVFGADLNLFVQNSPPPANNSGPARVATFLFAGIQGRFDVGGTRSDGRPVVAWRPREGPGVTASQPPTIPVSPSVAVSEDLMRDCALNLDNIDKAPKFEFDKSDVQSQDAEVLKKIAECFTAGPMKGATLGLVGRADPRGSLPYNDALGMRRASGVAGVLEQYGLDADRMNKSSRGERDARGSDEASWVIDRRVDLVEGH